MILSDEARDTHLIMSPHFYLFSLLVLDIYCKTDLFISWSFLYRLIKVTIFFYTLIKLIDRIMTYNLINSLIKCEMSFTNLDIRSI